MTPREREDEALREAFLAMQEDARLDEVDHDRVWAAVTGQVSPDERRNVLDLVARDPSWAFAWRLAHELTVGAAEDAPVSTLEFRKRSRSRLLLALVAAGIVLAAGLRVIRGPSRPGSEYREAPSVRIEDRTPGHTISWSNGCRIEWRGPFGATFELRLTTEDLSSVRTSEGLATGEYRVPPEFLAGIPQGSRLLWQVEARLPDGSRLSSQTFAATYEKECGS